MELALIPSLSSFFADRKSLEVLFNYKRGYAFVTRVRVDGGKEYEDFCLVAIGYPELLAADFIMVRPYRPPRVFSANASDPLPASLNA